MTTQISDFLQGKWREFFRFFDVNKDGLLTLEDHEAIANNLSKIPNASTEITNTLREMCKSWFYCQQPDPSIAVDVDHFVASMTEFYQDLDKFKLKLKETGIAMFDSIDSNKNGVISIDEFTVFYNAFGRENTAFMHEVFQKIDTNGDGYIQREEFIDDYVRFFADPDSISGQAFLYSMPKENKNN